MKSLGRLALVVFCLILFSPFSTAETNRGTTIVTALQWLGVWTENSEECQQCLLDCRDDNYSSVTLDNDFSDIADVFADCGGNDCQSICLDAATDIEDEILGTSTGIRTDNSIQ